MASNSPASTPVPGVSVPPSTPGALSSADTASAGLTKNDSYESLLRGSAGGYIGAGVIREYQEEFGLQVNQESVSTHGHHSGGFLGMSRSKTVGDVKSLFTAAPNDVKGWRVPVPSAGAVERTGKTPLLTAMRPPPLSSTAAGGGSGSHHSLRALSPAVSQLVMQSFTGPNDAGTESADGDLGISLDEAGASASAGLGPAALPAATTHRSASSGGIRLAHFHSATTVSSAPPLLSSGPSTPAGSVAASSADAHGRPALPHSSSGNKRIGEAGASASTPAAADVVSAVGLPVTVKVDSLTLANAPSPTASVNNTQIAVNTLTNRQSTLRREGKLVLSMVGLPARGKTAIAQLLRKHLTWLGYSVGVFNVGNVRRKHLGAAQPAEFFDPSNPTGTQQRQEMARLALEEMVKALSADMLPAVARGQGGGSGESLATTPVSASTTAGGGGDGSSPAVKAVDIAIFDATNTTVSRRQWLRRELEEHGRRLGMRFQLVFIESICDDESIVRANVEATKLKMPDYKGMAPDAAVVDFLQRIDHYKKVYEPLDCPTASGGAERDTPYIKLIDVGRQLIANRISGYLNSRISFFLSNLHITPRPIWLSRHGESEFNVAGRIGGDSLLSPRGYQYATKLGAFMRQQYPLRGTSSGSARGSPFGSPSDAGSPQPSAGGDADNGSDGNSGNEGGEDELLLWTSNLRRTVATAAHVGREIIRWTELNEIDAGIFDGMTYEQIAAAAPDEYAARGKNKYRYRYPRGESYADIAERVMHPLTELMRTKKPVLIISHQATLRVLYSYLTDKSPESCPEALIPLHTVIKLTPTPLGMEETRYELM